MVASGAVAKGMVPKALHAPTPSGTVWPALTLLDGRVTHAILLELLTSEGVGTMVVAQ